jgi:transposase
MLRIYDRPVRPRVWGYRRADESFDSGTHDAAADQSDRSETNVGERPATHHPADLITRFEVLATIIRPIGIRLVVASRPLPHVAAHVEQLVRAGTAWKRPDWCGPATLGGADHSFDSTGPANRADFGEGHPKEVVTKFRVSRSWVKRLVQRHRETGEIGPRPQKVFKKQAFASQETRLRALVDAQPDQTLAELRETLQSSASLSSLWRALDRLQLTLKKNGPRRRTAPTRRGG